MISQIQYECSFRTAICILYYTDKCYKWGLHITFWTFTFTATCVIYICFHWLAKAMPFYGPRQALPPPPPKPSLPLVLTWDRDQSYCCNTLHRVPHNITFQCYNSPKMTNFLHVTDPAQI
jgi:hypothetical protein